MKQKYSKFGKRRRLSLMISFFFHLKRNHLWLRRFAWLGLLLIAFEVSCPILECQSTEGIRQEVAAVSSEFLENKSPVIIAQQTIGDPTSVLKLDESSKNHCSDECLCHVGGVINMSFDLPKYYNKPVNSMVEPKATPTITLSPLFEPPKQA